MSLIFLSYATPDRPRIGPLVDALGAQGLSVWWDRTIPPGKTFDTVIEEVVAKQIGNWKIQGLRKPA